MTGLRYLVFTNQFVNLSQFHGCWQETETPCVKNKGKFITQSNSSHQRILIFAPVLQASIPAGWYKQGQVNSWLQKENLGLRDLTLLYWAVSTPLHCSGRKILPLFKTESKFALAPEGDHFSNCQGRLLYTHLEKIMWKTLCVFVQKMDRKVTNLGIIFSQQMPLIGSHQSKGPGSKIHWSVR